MRLATILLTAALALGCTKAKPTVPLIPGAAPGPGGDVIELPETTVFHTVLRSADHAGPVVAFYAPEMEKRGAKKAGDTFSDDNMDHQAGGTMPRDPSKPGVWLQIEEYEKFTQIDIWEAVPKAR